jgi:CheY-like chemotaxis protein
VLLKIAEAQALMTKIILCADDSVTMQTVAEITFKATEYTYVGARSADEALAKARAHKPALVLADAVMPGKTGYDLCQALKSEPSLADVPVVILCGNSQAYDPTRGAQVGADGSLQKPWDTQVILDKVAEIVDKGSTSRPTTPSPPTPVKSTQVGPPTSNVVPATAAPQAAAQRSATIMGMPSIKLPPQMGGPAVPATPTPAPATTVAMPPKADPITAPAPKVQLTSPNVVSRGPGVQPTSLAQPRTTTPSNLQPMAAAAAGDDSVGRAPMVRAVPTKRSALVERTMARMSARLAELSGLEQGSPELIALLKLSTEVVERVVWEVVPDLAEQIIRENLQQLAAARRN